MARNPSEIEFEKFCADNGIECKVIPTESEAGLKTADYYVYPAGEQIAVEVKEVQPSPEEKEEARLLEAHGWASGPTITPETR